MINETSNIAAGSRTAPVETVVTVTEELRRFGLFEKEIRWVGREDIDEAVAPVA